MMSRDDVDVDIVDVRTYLKVASRYREATRSRDV